MAHHMFPILRLDPLYSTRVQLHLNQDCGNSSLLPLDCRRDSLYHSVQLNLVHEVYWMPTLDTFFHSQSCSKFPCTHARVQSVYNLHKINIHRVNIRELHLLQTRALGERRSPPRRIWPGSAVRIRSPDTVCGFEPNKFDQIYTVFQKSDAKIQITITTACLIRIKYPLSGFNYHLSEHSV